jgi:hypothetical protein
MTTDNIYATKVLETLMKPFTEQLAYRLGIIDDKGNEIRKPKTRQEEEAYSSFFIVLFKVKQILNKLPASQSRLAQIAVVLQLIRQRNIPSEYKTGLAEEYIEEYLNRLIFVTQNSLRLIEEESMIKTYVDSIIEDGEAPATAPSGTTTAGIEPHDQPVIKPKKKPIVESHDTLYVSRPVLNREDIANWAKENGIDTVQDDMHTTICYSKSPVSSVSPDDSEIVIPSGDDRKIKMFGKDADVMVLAIKSDALNSRWQEFRDAGASWDWPDYSPHITITLNTKGVDISNIKPYTGEIKYGPEVFEPIKENWQDEATES